MPDRRTAIRIAFVHSFYSSRSPSGENGVVEAEVRALRAAGHDVALIEARTDELESEPAYGLRAAARVASGRGRNPLDDVEAFRPDIVHVHNLFPNFGRGWVKKVAVPVVATLHNYRVVCANGILFRDGAPCTDCVAGSSLNAIRHACYRGSRLASAPLAIATSGGAATDPLLTAAERVVVLSPRMQATMAASGLSEDKMVRWPNFLPEHLQPDPAIVASRETKWLYVGRLTEEKGIARLVDAWPESAPTLTVLGDGPLLASLRDRRRPNVDVVGKVGRGEVLEAMASSSGLVFPSLWFEGFPLIYPEAMAAGLPVLAFEGNTVAESVAEDGTGRVARWDEPLDPLISEATGAFPALRPWCRQIFEQRYSESAYVDRAEALYGDLLGVARP